MGNDKEAKSASGREIGGRAMTTTTTRAVGIPPWWRLVLNSLSEKATNHITWDGRREGLDGHEEAAFVDCMGSCRHGSRTRSIP